MEKINVQDEVMDIHVKYGMSEKANYEIQKLCERYAELYASQYKKRVDELENVCQEFIDRVERGEVKSKYTYGRMKHLLPSPPEKPE